MVTTLNSQVMTFGTHSLRLREGAYPLNPRIQQEAHYLLKL